MKALVSIVALTGAALICTPRALADDYSFAVHDPSATLGGQPFPNYSFTINTSTTPAMSDGAGDVVYDVKDQGASTFGPYTVDDEVTFFTSANGGGFQNTFSLTLTPDTQLFAGSTSNPTFLASPTPYEFDEGTTITITDLSAPSVSAAPEPGTWALMLGGVTILGGMLRVMQARRREDEVKDIATA